MMVSPYGVVANVLDRNSIQSEFECQLHKIHFQTKTLGKGIKSLIPSAVG